MVLASFLIFIKIFYRDATKKVESKFNLVIPDFSTMKQNFGKAIPATLVNFLNIFFSCTALVGVNIPLYLTLRRCVFVSTLWFSHFILKKKISWYEHFVTVMIILGSLIYSYGSLGDSDIYSFCSVLAANFFSSLYFILTYKAK